MPSTVLKLPMDWIPDYIKGKEDPSTIEFPHPLLEDVCAETYGVMVYQEQVMEAARRVAGYTLGGADILRRAMGKKKPEEMAKQREIFVKGAKEVNAIGTKKANDIFNILEKFAGYGFNKSHSAAYGIISYQTAYLKANHPVDFMAGVLACELGNSEKLAHFLGECQEMGISVLGTDVNKSGENFILLLTVWAKNLARSGLVCLQLRGWGMLRVNASWRSVCMMGILLTLVIWSNGWMEKLSINGCLRV